jgi:hypothetical protein
LIQLRRNFSQYFGDRCDLCDLTYVIDRFAQDILGSFAALQALIEQSSHIHLKAAALEWHGDYINAAEIHFQQGKDIM